MNEFDVLELTWKAVIVWSFVVGVIQLLIPAPYGRYTRAGYGFDVNVRVAWVLQECPSFVVPVFAAGYLGGDKITGTVNPNVILLSMFLLHYFQRYFITYLTFNMIFITNRVFIYSFLIQGGKATPFVVFFMAFLFCAMNGYVQSRYLLQYYTYNDYWFFDPRFLIGIVVFLLGLAINIQSDAILRGLRKPHEIGYKTPRGILSLDVYQVNIHCYH